MMNDMLRQLRNGIKSIVYAVCGCFSKEHDQSPKLTVKAKNITALLGLLCLVSACSSTPEQTAVDSNVKFSASPSTYFIGPGDTLEIFVWRNPELSTSVAVRPDGKISTPLVEDLFAVGRTPTELARLIETELSEFIVTPKVNVVVTNFVGQFSQQIRVVGQAATPKAISYRDGISILDVMIEVGGLGEFAAGNRTKVVRRVVGGRAARVRAGRSSCPPR